MPAGWLGPASSQLNTCQQLPCQPGKIVAGKAPAHSPVATRTAALAGHFPLVRTWLSRHTVSCFCLRPVCWKILSALSTLRIWIFHLRNTERHEGRTNRAAQGLAEAVG